MPKVNPFMPKVSPFMPKVIAPPTSHILWRYGPLETAGWILLGPIYAQSETIYAQSEPIYAQSGSIYA